MVAQKTVVGTVLAVALMGVVASVLGLLAASHTLSNTGTVEVVGVCVYSDVSCTEEISSIAWGNLQPGESRDVTIYVKNEGSLTVTLSMATGNWIPASASTHMTLSWNREGHVLNSGSTVQGVLTLSISSSISDITDFSFDITITGTEFT